METLFGRQPARRRLWRGGILLIVLSYLALSSCSPKIVEHIRTEYVYRDRVQVDTTYVHDSTWVKEYIKGDTVRITEYKDRFVYQYRYLTQVDTVTVRDSVAVERIKEVKVEKPLSWGKRVKLAAFWWLLAAVLGLCAWTFRKPILKLIKKAAGLIV